MAKKKTAEKLDKRSFIKTFNLIAPQMHRYEVFSDFVKMAAISLHNGIVMNEELEKEYLEIVAKYKKDEVDKFCQLLANLVELLQPEPMDMLGELYMELELSSDHTGQFFTPACIAQLMAKISCGDIAKQLEKKPFITVSEPACGAGGMVLAYVKEVLQQGYNPAEILWFSCIDIDRVAALMCYLQLSLWNVPAEVVIGNTITMEVRDVLYTPAHYFFDWDTKFRIKKAFDLIRNLENETLVQEKPEAVETEKTEDPLPKPEKPNIGDNVQFDIFIDHDTDGKT